MTYGGTVAPNVGINRNNITVNGGISVSKGLPLPIYPVASFSFQPNYRGGYTELSRGWSPYVSFGAGIYYSPSPNDIYCISLSPSYGTDFGAGYIWEWDRKWKQN